MYEDSRHPCQDVALAVTSPALTVSSERERCEEEELCYLALPLVLHSREVCPLVILSTGPLLTTRILPSATDSSSHILAWSSLNWDWDWAWGPQKVL